ncbi:hypothetical protein DY102_04695 [Apilactobacillus timberlakei]|uniref:DUF4097 family beta strand repeat-containing protein n=1 Tax=Apilactobacillus timberlakei TaxID=2008380 RepID=UPI00112B3873|nr:DUF4097 family beta strand repeat-containing protein [Apilactobacillus timberlakei]TPR23343.1 hypothetical protein DY102_04695 [Apilactobacillus timberlakei]
MKRIMQISGITIILGFILFVIGFAKNDFQLPNGQNNPNNKITHTISKKLGNFHSINLNVSNVGSMGMPVTIKSGNESKIEAKLSKKQQLKYSISNGQLNIKNKDVSALSNLLRVGYLDHNNSSITIYVKKGMKLSSISAKNDLTDFNISDLNVTNDINIDGGVKAKNIHAGSLKADSGDDDVYIANSKFDKNHSELSGSDGDVELHSNEFYSLNASSDDGDVSINDNVIHNGLSKIESSDGDVSLGHNSWHALSLSSSDGDISFDHQDIKHSLKANVSDGDINGDVYNSDNAKIYSDASDGDNNVDSSLNHSQSNKIYNFTSSDGDITIN